MLTGALVLPPPAATHTHTHTQSREVVFHSVASIFYAPCSANWSCAGMKGQFRKTTLPKPDTRHQSTNAGCLYYFSTCCNICLCYSESMCIAACSSSLASQVPSLFPVFLNVTTLETITRTCPASKTSPAREFWRQTDPFGTSWLRVEEVDLWGLKKRAFYQES